MKEVEIGKGQLVREGKDLAILTFGHVGNYALSAAEMLATDQIEASVYDMRFAKPLDKELLAEVFEKFDKVITVEDGCLMGGFGSAIIEHMSDNGFNSSIKRLGIPDDIVEHGTQLELHKQCGFDPAGIYNTAREMVGVMLKV